MISKMSRYKITESHQHSDSSDQDSIQRVVVSHHRPALNSQAIQHNVGRCLTQKKQLKAMLVFGCFSRFLRTLEAQQADMKENIPCELPKQNDEIEDPFMRRCMVKRQNNQRKVVSCYYAAISPVSQPVRNMRQLVFFSKTVACVNIQLQKSLKSWLNIQTKPPQTRPIIFNASLKRLSGFCKTNPRVSVDLSIPSNSQPISRQPSKQNDTHHRSTPKMLRSKLMPTCTQSFHKAQKLLQANLFEFQNLNKGVNNITHRNSTYEFVAIKYLVGSALSSAGTLKTDMLEMENYQGELMEKERGLLVELLEKVKGALKSINSILVSHIKKKKSEMYFGGCSPPHNSLERLSVYPQSKLRVHTDEFSQLYKQLTQHAQKFFSHKSNRLVLQNTTYKQLLQLATRARYGMMYLHRQMVQIVRKIKQSYGNRIKTMASTRHTTQMRILTDKYNITAKRPKESVMSKTGYFSQHNSPKKKDFMQFSDVQAKRLIKKFRNGEFNLSKV